MRHMPFLSSVLLTAALSASAQNTSTSARVPVLVELFTSEGCSSCPPADALLSRLQHEQPVKGAQIIVLGEHVDYWDGLGWRDRFSSQQYTARQNQYSAHFQLDSVYTPQMVVDGAAQFVGNDQTQAWRAVASASRTMKLPLVLSKPVVDGHRLSASVSATAAAAQGDLYAALIDPTDTTDVRRGENGGRRLQHVAVVRTLVRIGSVRDLGRGPVNFTLTAPETADPTTMEIVVFAQQNTAGSGLGPVLGAVISSENASPHTVAQSSGR